MTFADWLNWYAVGRLLGTHFGTELGGLWWSIAPPATVLGTRGGAAWKTGYADGRG